MRSTPSRRLGLAAAAFLGLASGLGWTEGARLSGTALQALSGAIALEGDGDFGTHTELSLALEAGDGGAGLRADFGLSLLTGREAGLLWASLKARPSRLRGLLLEPAFDASAAAPDSLFLASLHRLALTWSGGAFGAEAGFTTVNWGVGKAFSPADFFADIDLSSGRPRRLSRLLGSLSWFPQASSRIDLAADPVGPDGPTFASRAYGLLGETTACGAALGLRFPPGAAPHALGALDLSLDLGFAAPYGELFLDIPAGDPASFATAAMAGLQARLGDLVLTAEYLYAPGAAPAHSLYAAAALALDEWLSLSASASALPEYASGAGGLALGFSGSGGFSASLGASAARSAAGSWTLAAAASASLDF